MAYYPLRTIKLPSDSDGDVAYQKLMEERRMYNPALSMAPVGQYDGIRKEYIAALNRLPTRAQYAQFHQGEMGKRLRTNKAPK